MKAAAVFFVMTIPFCVACLIPGVETDTLYTEGQHFGFEIGAEKAMVFDAIRRHHGGDRLRMYWVVSRRDQALSEFNDGDNPSDTVFTWTREVGQAESYPPPGERSNDWVVMIGGNPKNVIRLTFSGPRLSAIRRTRVLFSRP